MDGFVFKESVLNKVKTVSFTIDNTLDTVVVWNFVVHFFFEFFFYFIIFRNSSIVCSSSFRVGNLENEHCGGSPPTRFVELKLPGG